MGEYWAPFAIVNDDWFSAVNRFAIVPLASRTFPVHYNEVEGEFDLGGRRGLNYALSLGNGVRGMGIDDQRGFDLDEDKAVVGRLGVFPAGPDFEVGLSTATMRFRGALDADRAVTDPRRYPARFTAYAVDARLTRSRLKTHGYGVLSWERLEGERDLRRWGAVAEAAARPFRLPCAASGSRRAGTGRASNAWTDRTTTTPPGTPAPNTASTPGPVSTRRLGP